MASKISTPQANSPKIVPNLFFSPGKNLFQVFAIAKDQPSAISSILQYVEPLAVVLRLEVDRIPKREGIQVALYVESKNLSTLKFDIARAINSSPLVLSCLVQESHNGLLLDTIQFPILQSSGVRAIVISQEVFNGIFTAVRKKFGSGGDVIIYDEGLAYGENQGKVLLSFFGRDKVMESLPELVKLYQSVGIGRPLASKFDLNKPSGMIRLYDSLECEGQTSKAPYSQFIRGHICGIANIMYGRQMKCREIACMARGDKYCEFQLDPA
jgi:predicted hydrocarbon binding protein